jgi:hypothetical protein
MDKIAKLSFEEEARKGKIQALSLANDCYLMKLDLPTNATVIEDAIRFVLQKEKQQKLKQKQISLSSSFSSGHVCIFKSKTSSECCLYLINKMFLIYWFFDNIIHSHIR